MTPFMSPPTITQGSGIAIGTLQPRAQANSFLPQSGTLPPVSCPPEDPCASQDNFWLWLLLLGGGALLLSQRKKGEKRGSTGYDF
jgi:hypothetical protein